MKRAIPDPLPEFVKKILRKPEDFRKTAIPLTIPQWTWLVDRFVQINAPRSNVLEVESLSPAFDNLAIIGDLRGEWKSLHAVLTPFLEEHVSSVIFLGDYIDDHRDAVYCLAVLLVVAITWPDQCVLLRGNHEDLTTDAMKGFLEQIHDIYPKAVDYYDVHDLLQRTFDHMSLCAITPAKSLCMHGGLPRHVTDLALILQIPKPHSQLQSEGATSPQNTALLEAFRQIRWNDPEDAEMPVLSAKSYHQSYFFHHEQLEEFLRNTHLHRIIRSHETQRGSFERMFNGQLIHVLSMKSESSPPLAMGYYAGVMKNGFIIHELRDGTTFLRDLEFKMISRL